MRSSSPIETEYSIDYTTITTTTKTTSPLHFLYPIMPSASSSPTRTSFLHHHSSSSLSHTASHNPHSHSLNSSHHSPGGKRHVRRKEREQQEIARLLDPSYQGGDSHQTQGRRSLEVYVDKDGDLHDPDFRYFPSAETFVSRTKRDSERKRRATSPRRGERVRPYWDHHQQEVEDALADEEEEEEMLAQELGVNDFLARAGYGNGTSSEYSPRSRSARSRRDGSFSSYARGYSGYSSGYTSYSPPFNGTSTTTTTTSYYSPTMTTTTLPTSYESETSALCSSAEQDGEKEVGVKGLLAAAKRRRRSSKGEKEKKDEVKEVRRSTEATRTSLLETTREEHCEQPEPLAIEATTEKVAVDDEEQREAEDAEDREFIQSRGEYVPTCTEVLKRHWLSISLRFKFGVYRAQRRFARRVHSMF